MLIWIFISFSVFIITPIIGANTESRPKEEGVIVPKISSVIWPSNVAIFRDSLPWSDNTNEKILIANNINYTIYSSASFEIVDLSGYDKIIIAGVQSSTFRDALVTPSTRIWFESYVNNGGILQINAVTQSSVGSMIGLPFGYNSTFGTTNYLAFNDSYSNHPFVWGIDPAEFDAYSSTAHNHFDNIRAGDKVIAYDDVTNNSLLFTSNNGSGMIIYTGMTLEYAYQHGYSTMLENVILYAGEISTGGGYIPPEPDDPTIVIVITVIIITSVIGAIGSAIFFQKRRTR